MKTKANEQEMTEMVRDFIGGTIAPEKPKTEPQPAETQEQASEAVQQEMAMANEPMLEQTDETPQVVRRISGKQRRASLEEYKETFLPVPSIEDRKPVFRCPRPHRPHVRRTQDERVGTGGEHRPAASCHLR